MTDRVTAADSIIGGFCGRMVNGALTALCEVT